jgi:hypothetical protein
VTTTALITDRSMNPGRQAAAVVLTLDSSPPMTEGLRLACGSARAKRPTSPALVEAGQLGRGRDPQPHQRRSPEHDRLVPVNAEGKRAKSDARTTIVGEQFTKARCAFSPLRASRLGVHTLYVPAFVPLRGVVDLRLEPNRAAFLSYLLSLSPARSYPTRPAKGAPAIAERRGLPQGS